MVKNDYKKLSYKQIESILANTKASLVIEGLQVADKETEVIRKYLGGIYTEKEVLELIRKS